jgi:hypothetical protein
MTAGVFASLTVAGGLKSKLCASAHGCPTNSSNTSQRSLPE